MTPGSTALVDQLAEFTATTEYRQLPRAVVEESKRLVLDSLGCMLAGTDEPKGRIGVDYGRTLGPGEATIVGTEHRAAPSGAAFANGELMSALDFDPILPPGHVTPYVLPGALAVAETAHCDGRALIEAIALSHEISYRFGRSMDYVRDYTADGTMRLSPVVGYASTIFGATAALGKLQGAGGDVVANALGIAGCISPVNSHRTWMAHAPSTTIKYTLAGALIQAAFTAAAMAALGHRGDRALLDDRELGYARFIGTTRWEPAALTDGLGTDWRFPAESSYKPYPHCRVLHGLLDGLADIVETHDIKPDEIEHIAAWGEAWVEQPVWLNNRIEHVQDAQFSMAHGLAIGAQRIPPSRAWQDPEVVFDPAVLALMERTTFAPHPDYVAALERHPSSRPSRVAVTARGTTFTAERDFPKGSPSPDPATYMTTDEIVAKFHVNAAALPVERRSEIVDKVLNLERVDDLAPLMRLLAA
ncbi:MmgE/PrpD family protein [Saccharomonospora sp. NPDC046836]|uniref:MmgE/PrpD family protein n=1 Tax=Saccharomonospora sp. NPDC046836 TaxID=3156921 RepID=UPI0033C55D5F